MDFFPKNRYLVSFWRYFNIVTYKTYANLKGESSKTYLGCIWWILEPIINTAVFYCILSLILNRHENIAMLYIGIVAYGYFSNAINTGANAIVAHAGIMQQIYLPKIVFVIISLCNLTWKFLFSLIVLFPLLYWYHAPLTWSYLALPILLLLQFWIVLGITMPLASLIPYFQDGKTVIASFLNIFIWCSGVYIPTADMPEKWRSYFYYNPIAVIIEGYRDILINGHWPQWSHFGKTIVVGVGLWIIGCKLLQLVDRKVTKLNM